MKNSQYYIREYIDRPVTKKDFLTMQEKEITGNGKTKQYLIKNKIFTEKEIKKLVKEKTLIPIKLKNYFEFLQAK